MNLKLQIAKHRIKKFKIFNKKQWMKLMKLFFKKKQLMIKMIFTINI